MDEDPLAEGGDNLTCWRCGSCAAGPEDADRIMTGGDGEPGDAGASGTVEPARPEPPAAAIDTEVVLRQRRNERLLYRHTAWQGVISALITTFMPVFAVRAGASPVQVGLLTSLPALVVIALTIPASAFTVRRNLVRIVSITIFGVWSCAAAITFLPSILTGANSSKIPMAIIALSCLSAAFAATSSAPWTAVLADAVSARRRPIVNGQRWALVSVVGGASTLIGGWYLGSIDFPRNYQTLVPGAMMAGLVSIFYLEQIRIAPADRGGDAIGKSAPWQHLASVPAMFRSQPAFLRFVSTTFVCRLGIALPAALYPIFWVNVLHATDRQIGVRAMAGQAALVVSYAVWGRLAGRRGHRVVLISSCAGIAFYPVLTGFVPSPLWLAPVAIVWGMFAGGIDVSFFEGLVDVMPADQRVAYAAVNTTFANLSIFVGPLIGIALVELIGMRATFFVAGGVGLLGAWLYYSLVGKPSLVPSLDLQLGSS